MPDDWPAVLAAIDQMEPATWDDPLACETCGIDLTVDEAHSPHELDCPQFRWGAHECWCDRTTCRYCCTDRGCQRRVWPTWALLLMLWILLVLSIGFTILMPDGPATDEQRCPDHNGACIFDD